MATWILAYIVYKKKTNATCSTKLLVPELFPAAIIISRFLLKKAVYH